MRNAGRGSGGGGAGWGIRLVHTAGRILTPMKNVTAERRMTMKAGVTKEELIRSLEQTVKLTREGVQRLELADNETVIIHYESGASRNVNIAMDSGLAIIRDVVRAIN